MQELFKYLWPHTDALIGAISTFAAALIPQLRRRERQQHQGRKQRKEEKVRRDRAEHQQLSVC